MPTKVKPTLTDSQVLEAFARWKAEGFVHLGMGNLQDDDPPACPMCGEQGYFYSLFEHPTRTYPVFDDNGAPILNEDGTPYNENVMKSYNRCEECDYEWLDED